jgi:hypothetical protein
MHQWLLFLHRTISASASQSTTHHGELHTQPLKGFLQGGDGVKPKAQR